MSVWSTYFHRLINTGQDLKFNRKKNDMRRRVKCCMLLRIHFSTANQKIQIYFRYQSYTRRNLKKTVELWGREWLTIFFSSLRLTELIDYARALEPHCKSGYDENCIPILGRYAQVIRLEWRKALQFWSEQNGSR